MFNPGETEKEFTFSAAADTIDDDDESVKLTFGSLPSGVTEGGTKETVVSITDDDVPSVSVSFGSANYTVTEGSTVTVTVTLSENPERSVTVPLTKANQGGASDSDYSGVPVEVVFNSGDDIPRRPSLSVQLKTNWKTGWRERKVDLRQSSGRG